MDNLQLTQVPVMKTGMLIRKPVAEVFEAFIDPDITTQFWFTRSSGRLAPGAQVEWAWEMYDVSAAVTVQVVTDDGRTVSHHYKAHKGRLARLLATVPREPSEHALRIQQAQRG